MVVEYQHAQQARKKRRRREQRQKTYLFTLDIIKGGGGGIAVQDLTYRRHLLGTESIISIYRSNVFLSETGTHFFTRFDRF